MQIAIMTKRYGEYMKQLEPQFPELKILLASYMPGLWDGALLILEACVRDTVEKEIYQDWSPSSAMEYLNASFTQRLHEYIRACLLEVN